MITSFGYHHATFCLSFNDSFDRRREGAREYTELYSRETPFWYSLHILWQWSSLFLSYIYHRHIHASSPASLRREHICIGFTTVNDTARLRILKMYDPAL